MRGASVALRADMRTRLQRATCALFVASLTSLTAAASADDRWSLDPGGEWTATPQEPAAPQVAPARTPPIDGALAPTASDGEDVERSRRSPAALAGGIVLVSVSGLAAIYGTLVAIDFKGYGAGGYSDAERAPGYTSLGLGLAGIAGGITLIAWGAQREQTATKVSAGPGKLALSGAF